MEAIVYHEYGTPANLALQEIERPDVPEGGVLVKVHATCRQDAGVPG